MVKIQVFEGTFQLSHDLANSSKAVTDL